MVASESKTTHADRPILSKRGWVATAMADEQMQVIVDKRGSASIDEAYQPVTKDALLGRPMAPRLSTSRRWPLSIERR